MAYNHIVVFFLDLAICLDNQASPLSKYLTVQVISGLLLPNFTGEITDGI